MTRLRILIIAAIAIAVLALAIRLSTSGLTASAASVSEPRTGITATIDQGDVQTTLTASGSIQANQQVSLSFQTTGKVVAINVSQGDHVLKGQVLAALDSQTPLDSVLLAQAKLNAAQIALRRLTDQPRQVDITVDKTAINLAQAQLDEALHSIDRLQAQIAQLGVDNSKNALWVEQLNRDAYNKAKKDLQDKGLTAQANALPNIDTAENAALTSKDFDVQVAQANLEAAQTQSGNMGSINAAQAQLTAAKNALDKLMEGGDKADVARAQAGLRAAQTALDQAKSQLNKTRLIAPFDGIVAKLNLNLGEQLPTGPAAIMLDTSTFYVDLQIDEVDISKIANGQQATLKFDALPGVSLPGTVIRISQTGDKTGSLVTYTVRVQINPNGQPLLSSMTTTVTISTGKAVSVIRIPDSFISLDRSTGKDYALVRQADGSSKQVDITLGVRSDSMSEVKTGLAAGDVVVMPLNGSAGSPQ